MYPYEEDGEDENVTSGKKKPPSKQDDMLAAFGFTRADDDLKTKPVEHKTKPEKADYPVFKSLERVETVSKDEDAYKSYGVSKTKGGSLDQNGQSLTQNTNKEYQVEKLERLNVTTKTKDGHRAWSWVSSAHSHVLHGSHDPVFDHVALSVNM